MEAKMPGDPKECRQHAERCAELARLARTAEDRDKFLSLQMIWIRLALELDQAGALIKAMQELDEEPPIKAAEYTERAPTGADALRLLRPAPGGAGLKA